MKEFFIVFLCMLFLASCKEENKSVTDPSDFLIDSVIVNGVSVPDDGKLRDVDNENLVIRIHFNYPVDTAMFEKRKVFISGGVGTSYDYWFSDNGRILFIRPDPGLSSLTLYRFVFDTGPNLGGVFQKDYIFLLITKLDPNPKFPEVTDDSLLSLVQERTFRYFWDYGHPVSGLTRERYGSDDIVTSGGSGFGIMAILTAIRRQFIDRRKGFERIRTIVNFLNRPQTSTFHGAFPHWLNGTTGKVIPFSPKDNGGDLVETAFLMQGLLTAREYFRNGSAEEKIMCDSITAIWEKVEWDWYRRGGQNKLYWHWSPDHEWEMNMPVAGWNEAMIVYVLAASSPVHSIPKQVYDEGWARNGAYPMKNGKIFYNLTLPLGEDFGGPLSFAHYSFLGLDPRNLTDQYAEYWDQNVTHTLINYNYCVDNPEGHSLYGPDCWGLTASDIPGGYSASSPLNDLGVIAPTAAISSMPYTPDESMKALKFFYYTLGDKLWGEFGFYDAFSPDAPWFAESWLAIDQGPIICMIENYRSGFLWNTFMSSEEIRNGLTRIGLKY